MKFQSLSVVAGTKHCNAACPFCVSRMTGLDLAGVRPQEIHRRNLLKTLRLARMGGVSTAIITGKGEPTLFPHQIDEYLEYFDDQFPFVELQTNAIHIANGRIAENTLQSWYDRGLTTILISNVGYDAELNRQTYMPKSESYLNIEHVIDLLKRIGYIVRMTCVGIKGGIDNADKFQKYLEFCSLIGADQVTWRPVSKPDTKERSDDQEVYDWTVENSLTDIEAREVRDWVTRHGVPIRTLAHGGAVFDVNGQNVCMTDCLTHDHNEEELRQLIFFPDGELYTDWQFAGSRLL